MIPPVLLVAPARQVPFPLLLLTEIISVNNSIGLIGNIFY